MAEAEAATEPVKSKKMSGKKLVLFIVLPLLLLAGGGAAAFLLLGKEEEKPADAAAHEGDAATEEEHAEEDADAEAHPPIFVELPEMTANLVSTSKKGAFLRLKAENTGMVPFIMQQKAAGWGPELLKRRIAAPSGSLVGRGLRRVFNK